MSMEKDYKYFIYSIYLQTNGKLADHNILHLKEGRFNYRLVATELLGITPLTWLCSAEFAQREEVSWLSN